MVRSFVRMAAVAALLLGAAAPHLQAQSAGILVGRVVDAVSRAPLADVQVGIGTRTAATDADGRFRLDAAPLGAQLLRARRVGYAPLSRTVTVRAGTDTLDLALTASFSELTPLVVTATRDTRSIEEVPVPVSVADSTTIQSGRTAGLHEVLRLTPGVIATSRYGLDDVNLSIRGSGVRTTFGVRGVAVVVDGVPITEPDGQTRLDLVELGAARQVEVVRGPASALYGGTASGGVVNVISRGPAESRGLTLRGTGGSFGFRKYDGAFGAATAEGRAGVYLSGTWTESDGFRAHNRDVIKRTNLRAEWRPGARTRLGLEASSSDLDMKIPGNLTRTEYDATPFAAEPNTVTNNYGRRDIRWRSGLKLDQSFPLAGREVEATAYGFYGGRELDHPIFQVVDNGLHRTQAGARARIPLTDDATDPWRLTVGADYDKLFGSQMQFTNAGGNRGAVQLDQAIDIPNVGVFSQLEGRIAPRVGLTLGGRWDRVEYGVVNHLVPARSASPDFTQFSPKGTLSYALGSGGSLYGSVARGFDVPTLGEKTASADPTVGFNPALQPKRVWNYEVGVKSFVTRHLFVDASVYRQAIRGELLPRQVAIGNQTVTVYDNAGRSRHWGAEVAATATVSERVAVGASYTFSDFTLLDFTGTVVNAQGQNVVTDFAGKKLPGVPKHRVAAEVRVRPVDGLSLGMTAEYQSEIFVDNANTTSGTLYVRGFGPNAPVAQIPFGAVDGYGLIHLAASYRLRGQTLFVNVENLLDTRYVGSATLNSANGRFYSTGAGRYVAAGVTLSAFGGR